MILRTISRLWPLDKRGAHPTYPIDSRAETSKDPVRGTELKHQMVHSKKTLDSPRSNPSVRIYRGRLTKLCRLRNGTHFLPDNDDGRALLTGLLRFGLSNESARESAPWLNEDDLAKAKRDAWKIKWKQVGPLIRLTYEERAICKLGPLDPWDVSPEEVQRRYAEDRKKRDRERKRHARARKREQTEAMIAASDRCDAVLKQLSAGDQVLFGEKSGGISPPRPHAPWTYQGWVPVSRLVELAKRGRAFRRPDGQVLANLRDAVHRTVKRLVADGLVETKTVPGQRGSVLIVRKVDLKPRIAGKTDEPFDRRTVEIGR